MELGRILKRLDYVLLFAVLALTAIGITLIGSATHINLTSEDRYWFVQRQSMFAVLNLMFIFFSLRFDYRPFGRHVPKTLHLQFGYATRSYVSWPCSTWCATLDSDSALSAFNRVSFPRLL